MNLKSIAGILVGLVAYFGVKYGIRHFTAEKPVEVPAEVAENPAFKTAMAELDQVKGEIKNSTSIEEALALTEKALSKTLPLAVDEVTTMTKVKAGPGKKFTYDYVLEGAEVESLTSEQLESAMRPMLETQYKGPNMRAFRSGGVTAIYRYSNLQGELMCEIVIEP